MQDVISSRAAKLYADAIVWDAHSGFPPAPSADLRNLLRWKNAGVDYLSVNVGYDLTGVEGTISTLATFRRWLAASDAFELVGRTADIERTRSNGRMAVTFDLEGAITLGQNPDMVGLYYELGVRQMLLAYNRNNPAAGGCHDEDKGLSRFGRQVISEMNRVGMLVDCSHCGFASSLEIMETSTDPVVFSHSNARSLHNHERNIVDRQAKACAASGGVVGIVGLDLFLTDGPATEAAMADHITYFSELIGPEHVGLGLDYDWDGESAEILDFFLANAHYWPENQYPARACTFLAPDRLPELVEVLLKRGFTNDNVRGVLGGNFMRVAGQVWK